MTNMTIEAADGTAKLELARMLSHTSLPALGQPYGVGLTQAHWTAAVDGHTIQFDMLGTGYNRGVGLLDGTATTSYMKFTAPGVGSVALNDFQLGGEMKSVFSSGTVASLFEGLMGYNKGGVTYLSAYDDILSNPAGQREVYLDVLHSEVTATVQGHDALITSARGSDIVLNTSSVSFLDGELSLDPLGNPAQVARLYIGVLGREAEATGLAGWAEAMENHLSLHEVAERFIDSPEFEQRFGNVGTEDFVRLLYRNVLGHETSVAEMSPWISKLDAGSSKADIVLGFTEYTDNINHFADTHASGVMVLSRDALEVNRLSEMTLGRLPDQEMLKGQIAAVHAGATYLDVGRSLFASGESQAMLGHLDNKGYVDFLSVNMLGHHAETPALESMAQSLDAGQTTRFDVAWAIAHSDAATSYLSHELKADYFFS